MIFFVLLKNVDRAVEHQPMHILYQAPRAKPMAAEHVAPLNGDLKAESVVETPPERDFNREKPPTSKQTSDT